MAREMKDSGIEWIGEIPKDWGIIRMKDCFSKRCGGSWGQEATGGTGDCICLRIADFDYDKFRFKDCESYTVRNYPENILRKLTLKKGDILIEKSGGGEKTPVGRTVIFDKDFPAIYANFMDCLRCNEKVLPNYIQYVYVTFYKNKYIWNYIKQTTGIQNLDITTMLAHELIPYPSSSEQQQIADFLDQQCAQIDSVIAHTRTSIEEYKKLKQSVITQAVTKGLNPNVEMKDSGIEWIGEIPKKWDASCLKYFLEVPMKYGANETGIPFDKDLPRYIRITDINFNGELKEENKLSLPFDIAKAYILKNNTVLFARSGATVGKTFLYEEKKHGKAAFAGYLISAQTNKNMLGKWLLYFTNSSIYWDWINSIFTQATIQNVSAGKYANMAITIPPVSEQQQIADYLDTKCAEIDTLIAKKEQFITEMEAYKKSLIYEYVTGKKEVI